MRYAALGFFIIYDLVFPKVGNGSKDFIPLAILGDESTIMQGVQYFRKVELVKGAHLGLKSPRSPLEPSFAVYVAEEAHKSPYNWKSRVYLKLMKLFVEEQFWFDRSNSRHCLQSGRKTRQAVLANPHTLVKTKHPTSRTNHELISWIW